jgi:transposase
MKKQQYSYSYLANYKLNDKSLVYNFRRDIIETYSEQKSYRKTAKLLNINIKTVIKWVKRFNEGGLDNLKDRKRAPKRHGNKISPEMENKIIELRNNTNFGARRLKYEKNLEVGVSAIYRVLKENNLIKKHRRKYMKKRDLREIKKKLKPFEQIQVDIKYLDDMPHFYKYYKLFDLPRYQITARDVKTGMLFLFYAYEKSISSTVTAMRILANHLKINGVNLDNVTIQTDNGAEFSGTRKTHDRGFRSFLTSTLGVKHKFIPPGYPNYNADVETSHRLIENEFYELEDFLNKKDFLNKAWSYQMYFNYARKNSYKNYKTPIDIFESEYYINSTVGILPPIIVDDYFDDFDKINKLNELSLDYFDNNFYSSLVYHHVPHLPVKFTNYCIDSHQ